MVAKVKWKLCCLKTVLFLIYINFQASNGHRTCNHVYPKYHEVSFVNKANSSFEMVFFYYNNLHIMAVNLFN